MEQITMIRLQKFIAQSGIASRRKSEDLILAGKIKVNGKIETVLGTKINENADEVEYNGRIVKPENRKIYIALNKPLGYISSTSDEQGKSVIKLVKTKERIFPVGRLDKDSSGLLLLTNDGEFANMVTHPRYGGKKEYFVILDQELRQEDIKKLEKGMVIGGKRISGAKIPMAKNKSAIIIIKEGVNRQIRRMLGKLGYTVVRLKRIKIGKLELGDLQEGKWKEIEKEEVI